MSHSAGESDDANQCWQHSLDALARVLWNPTVTLDPDRIVLGGGE